MIVQVEIPCVILQANIVLLISASLYRRDITPPQEQESPYHAQLVIQHQVRERRLRASAAIVRPGMAVRVLVAQLPAMHAQQVRTTRWPPAIALARHAMRMPARAHVQRRLQAHAQQAIPALMTA